MYIYRMRVRVTVSYSDLTETGETFDLKTEFTDKTDETIEIE